MRPNNDDSPEGTWSTTVEGLSASIADSALSPSVSASPSTVDRDRLSLFLITLVGLSGGFAVFTWIAGLDIVTLGPLYMFTPGVAGLAVCLYAGIELSDVGLRVGRLRWLAVSTVLSLPLVGAITVLSLGVPGVTLDQSFDLAAELGLPGTGIAWLIVAVGVLFIAGVTYSAILGFGEEFGWRGYLLWELAPLGFWKASLVIGTLWGLWHAPLIVAGHNYLSYPLVGIVVFTVICVAMSPLYTYLVVRSESVLPAAVFHGSSNTMVGLVWYAGTDQPLLRELVASPGGVVGLIVFVVVGIAIAVAGPPQLTRE